MRIVRDGDDLTSIALEVYGHAAAASAIHEANADGITDPQVLPIGLVLRLPPSWTLPSTPAIRGPAAIEPAKRAADAGAAATPGPDAPAVGPAAWLALPPAAPAPAPAAVPPAGPPATVPSIVVAAASAAAGLEPPPRPASVRAAPGDTLETIAERFYGDRSAARQIWLANRDRLRSPALVVPGMEISLP
jgi:nucleoid-associated protein YgaU